MRAIYLIISVLWAGFAFSQGALSFEKTTHDFGEVKEENGPVEYSFLFTNTGDQSIKITSVRASCGCTTPFWTQEEVAPGATGKITARYNTLNRPGNFNKSLRVNSTGNPPMQVLYIQGSVEAKPKTIKDELLTKIGSMRIRYRSFNFGRITTEKPVTQSFDVYNDSDSAFTFLTNELVLPDHLTIAFVPETLAPNAKGDIQITYDPQVRKGLGYQSDRIVFKTDEPEESEKSLYVVATIEEYFPPMTEEAQANAPKLTLDRKIHDFGLVPQGEVAQTTFYITNTGKENLNIRDTKANCGCTLSNLKKNDLMPGERIALEVTFDTKGRRGKQFKNVTVFSNDPKAPTQMVTIKAEVQVPEETNP